MESGIQQGMSKSYSCSFRDLFSYYSGKVFGLIFFFFLLGMCSNFDCQVHLTESSKPFEKQPDVLLSSRMF